MNSFFIISIIGKKILNRLLDSYVENNIRKVKIKVFI